MFQKAKAAVEVGDLLTSLQPGEKHWLLQRCRYYLNEERRGATEAAQRAQGEGRLTPQLESAFMVRAATFSVVGRVLDLLERMIVS